MCSIEKPQRYCPSEIVKLETALNLAEKWVDNMSRAAEDDPIEVEGRPSRLGLGAKAPHSSKFGQSNNLLERKLFAKLDTIRSKTAENCIPTARDGGDDDNDGDGDDEDLESRTSIFDKKRAAHPVTPFLQAKKKRR